MTERYNLITFETTHYSIAADKCLMEHNMLHKLIPIPQNISAGCGFCLKVDTGEFEGIKSALSARGIEMSGFYYAEKEGLRTNITKLG